MPVEASVWKVIVPPEGSPASARLMRSWFTSEAGTSTVAPLSWSS